MANILAQILIALNLLLGGGDHSAKATQIYNDHGYSISPNGSGNGAGGICNGGIVIIDTDEL